MTIMIILGYKIEDYISNIHRHLDYHINGLDKFSKTENKQ